MRIKIKKLTPEAAIPKYAHNTDAGLDLVATSSEYDMFGNVVYGTGLAVEIPEGFVGLIFPRSSIAARGLMLTNAVGVIDSGYRGEIMLKFKPSTVFRDVYEVGDRIGQMIILPYPKIEFEEAETLSKTDRGDGGYGSTGV